MRKLTSQTDKYISDNLRLINLAIRQAERTCEPIYIIALDAKKAFDSVRHNFIYKILRRLGLHGFSEIFNLLYHEPTYTCENNMGWTFEGGGEYIGTVPRDLNEHGCLSFG